MEGAGAEQDGTVVLVRHDLLLTGCTSGEVLLGPFHGVELVDHHAWLALDVVEHQAAGTWFEIEFVGSHPHVDRHRSIVSMDFQADVPLMHEGPATDELQAVESLGQVELEFASNRCDLGDSGIAHIKFVCLPGLISSAPIPHKLLAYARKNVGVDEVAEHRIGGGGGCLVCSLNLRPVTARQS